MLRLSMALFGSSFPSQIITSVPSALSSRQISHCLKRPQAEQYLYLIPVRTSNVNKCWQIRALRDWKEYEEAVQEKDLSRALQFLESLDYLPLETSQKSTLNQQKDRQDDGFVAESSVRTTPVSFLQPLRNREILDACLNAEDMKLVGRTYAFLQRRGFLPNFGKFKNIVAEGPRNVTPAVLKASTGLEASKLSPKKWGLSGNSAPILFATLVGFSYLLNNGIDLRPKLAVILGLGILDAIYLGGTGLAQVLSLWPPYKRRILVHEAGHLLTAYLLGCPIRGVILDPVLAMQMGIQGQAGTQFWDETLESELVDGRLTSTSFDRYCMVLFAGIASEALMYGEAEGGENDENLFKAIVSVLRPPWSPSQMSNQARWAVQQSYNLLREHRSVLIAAVRALEKSNSLGFVIKKIEDAMPSK